MINNNYLTISQVSERSGVSSSTLRFYEAKKLILSIRTSGNQRRYNRNMLRRLALIKIAQSVGFTLERITEELKNIPMNKTPTKRDWELVAKKWQGDLDNKIKKIELLKKNLTGCVGCGCLSMRKCHLLSVCDISH